MINQDIPTDSEDGLDSNGGSLSNDLDYDLDWDNACKNLFGENDSDELNKLMQNEFDTPIDHSVIFNDPPDYERKVTIDTDPSIPINPPNICVQTPSFSVTDHIFNSIFLTRSSWNQNQIQPQPQQTSINSNKKPIVDKNIIWSSGNLIKISYNFQGTTNLPEEVLELEIPLQIF